MAQSNEAAGQLQLSGGDDSLYMDAEETELLHRYATDNPNMIAFKNTDERIRTLEERFPESELEQLLVKARQLLAKRREELLGDEKVQPLPMHPAVPSVVELRELRNALIDQSAQISTHEPFVNLADVLAKEVALSEETRATVPYALTTLVEFYKKEVDRLPRRVMRYLQRYEMVLLKDTQTAVAFRRTVQDRLTKVCEQLNFARHALRAVTVYKNLHAAESQLGDASRLSGGADSSEDHRHNAQSLNARLAEELHPLYFRYFVADQAHLYRVHRRMERFVSRGQFVVATKRYELFAAAMSHLVGGQPAVGADTLQVVPLLTKQETAVTDQLDHLCSCFRIAPSESANDLQQFAYNVNRKYQIVFTSQNDDWVFSDDSSSASATLGETLGKDPKAKTATTKSQAPQSQGAKDATASGGDESKTVTYLRNTTWSSIKNIDPVQPEWEVKQELLLKDVSLTSEGGRQIVGEMQFLRETNVQLTIDRWKQRTEAFHRRFQHRRGLAGIMSAFNGSPSATNNTDAESESAAGDMAAITKTISSNPLLQRYLSVQQLRYIRTREFRRKLLDALNYFASILRMIAQDSSVSRSIAHAATGMAAIVVSPILCDSSVERDKSILQTVLTTDDPLNGAAVDTYSANLLRLFHDAVFENVESSVDDTLHDSAADNSKKASHRSTDSSKTDSTAKPVDSSTSSSSSILHADTFEVAEGRILVRRVFDSACVMDRYALDELENIENWIARAATFYVNKFNDDTYPIDSVGDSSSPQRATSPATNADAGNTVDYSVVLEDLLESESWYSEGKVKVLNNFREAYEQCTDSEQLRQLAEAMIRVIRQRPRLDTSEAYFTSSYTREVVNLELQNSLLREILQSQVADERKILSTAAGAPHHSGGVKETPGPKEAADKDGKLSRATSTVAGKSAANTSVGNAPSLSGARVRAADTADFPAALQRSLQRSNVDPSTFGLPEVSINDPRLYAPLFPGSSIVNQFDLYRSLATISHIPQMVAHAVHQVMERFNLLHYTSACQVVEREILQELLIQWRLLGEEDRLGRQMMQSSLTDVDAEGPTNAAFNSIRDLDAIIDELVAEEDIATRKRSNLAAATGEGALPAPAGFNGLGPNRALAPLSVRCYHYITIMELYHVRSALLTSLYETELLYGLHRRQGKVMGLSVKKSQLGPIDFETRRTFAEVDDLEAFKDTSNPLEEILSIKTEMLSSLSIAEFDAQMAVFDLNSFDGVRRLVSHGAQDFRRALTVQLCTKNMVIAATNCNMVALDVFFETLFKQTYDRAVKQLINFKHPIPPGSTVPLTHCRMRSWPGVTALVDHSVVDVNNGTSTSLDRTQLVKYFVSINAIKSVFRKSILNEMNSRTSDIMSSKKPETLRKVLRELKNTLVQEYCLAVTMATYQLSVKYQCCALALHLRHIVQSHPKLNFFILGAANDVIRPAPRGAAAGGESRRAATCMITRNGRIDESRYIPNVLQILAMDYQAKDVTRSAAAPSGGAANTAGAASPSGSASSACVVIQNLSGTGSYLRSNTILSLTARVLYHWTAIMRLMHTMSNISPAARFSASHGSTDHSALDSEAADRAALAALEHWKTELMVVSNELDGLRDPNDTVSIVEYLEGKHSSLFLKLMAGLSNSKSYVERYNKKTAVRKFRALIQQLDESTRFTHTRFPRLLYPLVERWQAAVQQMAADERMRVGLYYGPLCSIKKLLDGSGGSAATDFDQALHEIEHMPASGLPLHRDEDFFYSELTRNSFAFVGDEVSVPLRPLDWLLSGLAPDEKSLLGTEVHKIDQLMDDCRDESESLHPIVLPPRNAKGGDKEVSGGSTAGVSSGGPLVVSHFEFILHTSRRDRLRDLYFTLQAASSRCGWQRATKAQKAATAAGVVSDGDVLSSAHSGDSAHVAVALDDLYARAILARGRVVCEKEAADKNDNRFRRKAKGNEKEVAKRQHQLLVMEINKLLLSKLRVEADKLVKDLEDAAAVKQALNSVADTSSPSSHPSTPNSLQFKTSLFTDFCRIVMARAMCTRPEGERLATFHIPESSLTLAMDTVGTRLAEWQNEVITSNVNVSEQLVRMLQKKVCSLESKLQHTVYLREVDAKSVERRTAASIADTKYELLFANGVLEKQLAAVTGRLLDSESRLRESVRVEYQERISKLESDLLLSEQRFQAFKKKTFRDVQASLEEIKRGAMLAVGKMENAPLHMKRQALRIAISDDELNTLKEQNAELKQAVLKTKIWYEIKGMRMKAAFEKKLKDATKSIEESRAQFWDNKEVTEKELKQLKTQLSAVQYQLSQSEIEIEMLRKDLQVQLSNKKDLVSWKLQNAKTVEELQIKLRKFEKWSAYDMDKIIAEYEKRQQVSSAANAEDDRGNTPTKRQHAQSGAAGGRRGSAPSGAVTLSVEEHKRLLEKVDREKKLKEQAFAKIDELRMAEAGSTEALVWQRKYFEAANELQKSIKELEATRAFLAANGLTLPSQAAPHQGAPVPSSAGSQHPLSRSTPAANASRATSGGLLGTTFELRPASTSSGPVARPPSNASRPPSHTDSDRQTPAAAASIPAASRLKK